MTERDFERLTRAWLDLMPSEAPDRTIETVLQAVERMPQVRRRAFGLPWRSRMNRMSLIAATALLATALIGGGWILSIGRPAPVQPTPSPSATPPAPSGPEAVVPLPPQLWGDWIADVPAIPEIAMPAGMIQLSVDWENGEEIWLQTTPDYRQLLSSAPLAASSGELRIRSNGSNTHCSLDAIGRYRWERVPSGRFLHLNVIEEACPTRSKVFARVWVRSLGAVHDGGQGVNYGVTPMIQLTLPTGQRYGMTGGEQSAEINTFGDAEPFRQFVVIRNPGGFGDPCSTSDTQKLPTDTATLVEYIDSLPGASFTMFDARVDGRAAIGLDVTIDPGAECASGSVAAFHPENMADEYVWALAPGETRRMYIVSHDADTTFLIWYIGPEGELADVIASISFIDELPLP